MPHHAFPTTRAPSVNVLPRTAPSARNGGKLQDPLHSLVGKGESETKTPLRGDILLFSEPKHLAVTKVFSTLSHQGVWAAAEFHNPIFLGAQIMFGAKSRCGLLQGLLRGVPPVSPERLGLDMSNDKTRMPPFARHAERLGEDVCAHHF